jgi:hypothetical protein
VYTPGEWIVSSVWYLVRETWVYYRVVPVLLTLAAAVGLWRAGRHDLALIVVAGLVTLLSFFLVGMFFGVYTRYMLFGAPFIALGAGFMLDQFTRRGAPARVLAFGILLAIVLSGLSYWAMRVIS